MTTQADTFQDTLITIEEAALKLRDELYTLLSGQLFGVIAEWYETNDERNSILAEWERPGGDVAEEAVSRTTELLKNATALSENMWQELCIDLLDLFADHAQDWVWGGIDWSEYASAATPCT